MTPPPHALEAVKHAADDWLRKFGDGESSRATFLRGYTDEDRADVVFDARATVISADPVEAAEPLSSSGLSSLLREGFRPSGLAGELARRVEADRSRQDAPADVVSGLNSGVTLSQDSTALGARFDSTNSQES